MSLKYDYHSFHWSIWSFQEPIILNYGQYIHKVLDEINQHLRNTDETHIHTHIHTHTQHIHTTSNRVGLQIRWSCDASKAGRLPHFTTCFEVSFLYYLPFTVWFLLFARVIFHSILHFYLYLYYFIDIFEQHTSCLLVGC